MVKPAVLKLLSMLERDRRLRREIKNMALQKHKAHQYAIIISWSDDPGDKVFVADVPELPGCTAHGGSVTFAG